MMQRRSKRYSTVYEPKISIGITISGFWAKNEKCFKKGKTRKSANIKLVDIFINLLVSSYHK